MRSVEDIIAAAKLNDKLNELKIMELINKKEQEKKNERALWILAGVGAVAAIAAIAYIVYSFVAPDYDDDFEDDFDDDDFEDFFTEEDEV